MTPTRIITLAPCLSAGLLILAGAPLLVAAGEPPDAETLDLLPPDIDGAVLFDTHCAVCHGKDGDGKGQLAHLLKRPPRDLRAGKFLHRASPHPGPITDDDLFATISRGAHGTPMAAWGFLEPAEIKALVRHVRTLAAASTPAPPATPPK